MTDIAFILLYVENVAASEAFYVRTLGRPAIESSPGFAMIPAAPGVMLGLWRRDDIAPPAGAPGGSEIAFALESAERPPVPTPSARRALSSFHAPDATCASIHPGSTLG